MDWIIITLRWYIFLFLLGILFFPVTKKILHSFFLDYGYPFAKTTAIIVLSYIILVTGVIKILPFTQSSIFLLLLVSGLINGWILLKKSHKKKDPHSQSYASIILLFIFEELLFIASLLFWTYVRGHEPSIKGLEKYMDFGFINSILRTKYFPPLDMWLSADPSRPNGYPINYYYFGHLTGAFLIRLTGVKPSIGYNLILATIFALGVTQTFSLVINIIGYTFERIMHVSMKGITKLKTVFFGIIGAFILNLGGNLHTIYSFTTGYNTNDDPIPFWKILSYFNPSKYWYPNATRFIPLTIHEFPSYSYVVADLHAHVFDIPFVLLTLAILFIFFVNIQTKLPILIARKRHTKQNLLSKILHFILNSQFLILNSLALGFLTAVHYMTNAFDGPIYLLLFILILFFILRLSPQFFLSVIMLIGSFIVFSLPFSINFKPFVSGIGVNCSPGQLVDIAKLGPFLFEKGNCQITPFWMLFVLWGFFWVNFLLFIFIHLPKNNKLNIVDQFMFILFFFSTVLIIIPEFFYIKDIYPAHFRANTMFKLGYQAFMMMSISSTYVLFKIKFVNFANRFVMNAIFASVFFLVAIYPTFSIPSYYGNLKNKVELDGMKWLNQNDSENQEIIEYFNNKVKGQPVILEAQGDSYTEYNVISSYTGLPTVAGWWVHQWLWRGSSSIVGIRIPDITQIYESTDSEKTFQLLKKYRVKYIVVSSLERQKYPNLNIEKFGQIAKVIFVARDGISKIYEVN